MAILIQLLMFAAIAGVVLWLVVLQGRKARANLQALAQRQGFTTRIMEFFGTKEITVGDAAFDAAWFVQTNQPEFLAAALVPEIRARGMAALAARAKGSFSLKDGAVRYAEQGTLASAVQLARLEQQVPLLHYLADLTDVAAAAERG